MARRTLHRPALPRTVRRAPSRGRSRAARRADPVRAAPERALPCNRPRRTIHAPRRGRDACARRGRRGHRTPSSPDRGNRARAGEAPAHRAGAGKWRSCGTLFITLHRQDATMSRIAARSFAALLVALVGSSAIAPSARSQGAPLAGVAEALGRSGAEQPGGVLRFAFPRSDLTVVADSVTLKPAFALGSWVA